MTWESYFAIFQNISTRYFYIAGVAFVRGLLRYKASFDFYAQTREVAKRLGVKVDGGKGSYDELLLEFSQANESYREAYEKARNYQGSAEEGKVLDQEREGFLHRDQEGEDFR